MKQTIRCFLFHTLHCVVPDFEEVGIENKFCETCLGGFFISCRRSNKFGVCNDVPDPVQDIVEAAEAMDLNRAEPAPEVLDEEDAELSSAIPI